MRLARDLWILMFAWLSVVATGCGEGGATHNPTISYVYVDAEGGSDTSGDGSPQRPFRTITMGVSVAVAGYTVKVSPGTYDQSMGEVFPLKMRGNVKIEGDLDNKGNGISPTIIKGVGMYASASLGNQLVAIVCAEDATLGGFKIEASNGIGIWCEGNVRRMMINKNIVTVSNYGIVISETAQPTIRNNRILQNNIAGIAIFNHASPRIQYNTISDNSYGITIQNMAKPDIGTAADPGDNIITNNTICDINNVSDQQISAIGNTWDADQFLFNVSDSCSGGANIANTGGGAIIYQFIPLISDPVFSGSESIPLMSPAKGAFLATNMPRFTWVPTGGNYVLAGVFNKPIMLRDNRIVNVTDLVWAWHSGLGRGREGDVSYNDGVEVADGTIGATIPSQALARGKTYYWIVWAWDSEGIKIIRSSEEFYFTIAP